MDEKLPRLAGIELGGTKGIAVLAEGTRIVAQETVPTTYPEETLGALNAALREWNAQAPIEALGIASFGPVSLDARSMHFAHILDTPKPGWDNTDLAGPLLRGLGCPWRIETDVNAAALAEYRLGAAQDSASVCYVTIGTGVGGGLVVDGRPLHGALHPEIGHLCLRRSDGDTFAGACRFHGDCIEGLVSGPALARRFEMPGGEVPDDHPDWAHVANDLGELAASVILTTSADCIVFGGSVALGRAFLLPAIRARALERLGGYLRFASEDTMESIIGLARLGAAAGPTGAIVLADMAWHAAASGSA